MNAPKAARKERHGNKRPNVNALLTNTPACTVLNSVQILPMWGSVMRTDPKMQNRPCPLNLRYGQIAKMVMRVT